MTEPVAFNVHVHQYKTGALGAEVKENGVVVKEIWQDAIMSPKITLFLVRKQVEFEAWYGTSTTT